MSKTKLKQKPNPNTENDLSITLDCGCLATFPRGDINKGQMFLCKRHLSEDPFTTLDVLNKLGQGIKAGKTSFSISGRD